MAKNKHIQENREISDIFRELRQGAKPQKCILCGKPQSSFCLSHSSPRFVIKNIAVDGKVKTFQAIAHPTSNDAEVGIGKAMTFQYICRDCDSKYFSNYENEEILAQESVGSIALAEIALKNHLLMRYKWTMDEQFTKYSQEHEMMAFGADVKSDMDRLTLRDNLYDISVAQRVLKSNKSTGFHVIWHTFLDWKVPVCIQTPITMREDLHGDMVNDVFDLSEKNRTESIHLCVFPLKDRTLILLFYYNGDMKYRNFEKQFLKLDFDQKLRIVNYLMFAYTEHILLSPKIPKKYFHNRKLKRLCKENTVTTLWNFLHPPKKILPHQIPNFLAEEFAKEVNSR